MKYTAEEYLNRIENKKISKSPLYSRKEMIYFAEKYAKQLRLTDVIGSPILAKIEHINDLGKSKWYEVVYYHDGWYSYAGSKTFEDGEQVVDWKYCKDCI